MTEERIREIAREEIRTMLSHLAENIESTGRYLTHSQDTIDSKISYAISDVASDCLTTRDEIGEDQQ